MRVNSPEQAAGAVAHEIPVKQITEDLQKQLKALEDELKLKQAGLALDLEKARGDQAEIERIHARQQALEKDILTRKNAAVADAESKSGGLVTADTTGNQAALINLETAALKEQHKAQDEARAAALAGLEADRRILAQAEAADLASVQRREKAGEITAEAASAAEQQIVAAHQAAAGQILAKEEELARDETKLWQEVQNRKAELAQQSTDKQREIQEKADEERLAAAKAIDSEIAGSFSSGIMQALKGGKESIGQVFQKIIEEQEQKFLDQAIKQVLDASGIGEAIAGGEKGLLGLLPGGKKDTTTGPDRLAAAALKTAGDVDRLGNAAAGAAGKLSGCGCPVHQGPHPRGRRQRSPRRCRRHLATARPRAAVKPMPGRSPRRRRNTACRSRCSITCSAPKARSTRRPGRRVPAPAASRNSSRRRLRNTASTSTTRRLDRRRGALPLRPPWRKGQLDRRTRRLFEPGPGAWRLCRGAEPARPGIGRRGAPSRPRRSPRVGPGGPVAVDIRAVGGATTTSVGGGLPITPAGETGAGGGIGASGPPAATAGGAECDATSAGSSRRDRRCGERIFRADRGRHRASDRTRGTLRGDRGGAFDHR